MDIKIQGHKNILDLNLSITNNKLNVLYGLSGSGKTSISEALVNLDHNPLYSPIGFTGVKVVEIDGSIPIQNSILVFNDKSLSSYIIDSEQRKDTSFSILVDDDELFKKAKVKLYNEVSNLRVLMSGYSTVYSDLLTLQKKTGAELAAKKNELKPSSPINKIKKQLSSKKDTNIYKMLSMMDKNFLDWIITGTDFCKFSDSVCPFCSKKISEKLKTRLLKIKNFDSKSISSLKLTPEEESLLGTVINHSIKSIDNLHKKMISVGVAIKEFSEMTKQIELLDIDSNQPIPDFLMSEETFSFFPSLRQEIKKTNSKIVKINRLYNRLKDDTKALLRQKTDAINVHFKSFGVPYEIKAKYKNSKIDEYVLFHSNDTDENDRTVCLSTGETKIISLILFVLKHKNNSNKLIIFDDPISSYDDSRRMSIFNFILNHLSNNTILILSHDQLFSKFATHSKQIKKIGDVYYFENYDGIPNLIRISKQDFKKIDEYITHRIQHSTTYMQQIINLRYFYEGNKNKRYIYSYLSAIIHREPLRSSFYSKSESDIINEIYAEHNLMLPFFNSTFYNSIDTSGMAFFEKAFVMRELTNTKNNQRLLNELSYYIHLNGRELVSLDPYKFKCASKYLYDHVQTTITGTINYI